MTNGNPFIIQQQQQQQQQPGLGNILQGFNIADQFGAFGGSGAATGAGAEAGTSGAGAGSSSAVASAGPWAALAAIIYANESYASAHGDRDPDPTEYGKDLFSGEVFHQDLEKRFLPNLGIEEGSGLSKGISLAANPMNIDPGKTWERIKDIF